MMPFSKPTPKQMIQRMMQNPQVQQYIQNNPQAQEYLQVIMDGDERRGKELAQNLCQTYGVTPEQGMQQVQQFVQQNLRSMGFF